MLVSDSPMIDCLSLSNSSGVQAKVLRTQVKARSKDRAVSIALLKPLANQSTDNASDHIHSAHHAIHHSVLLIHHIALFTSLNFACSLDRDCSHVFCILFNHLLNSVS